MQNNRQYIIDPQSIQDVKSFEWIAKKIASGFLHGKHNSSRLGAGMEFQQYRPYVAGDDIRGIDWKMYAKTDKLYLKQSNLETEQKFSFIIDNTASMQYHEKGWSKLMYTKLVTAAMMRILSNQGDHFRWQSGNVFMPFGSGQKHWQHCIDALYHLDTGDNRLAELMHHQQGTIVWISDFYLPKREIEDYLKLLKKPKSEIILLHILGEAEKNLNFGTNVTFVDLETKDRIDVNSDKSRKEYMHRLSAHIQEIRNLGFEIGAMYEEVLLNGQVTKTLQRFFHNYHFLAV